MMQVSWSASSICVRSTAGDRRTYAKVQWCGEDQGHLLEASQGMKRKYTAAKNSLFCYGTHKVVANAPHIVQLLYEDLFDWPIVLLTRKGSIERGNNIWPQEKDGRERKRQEYAWENMVQGI